MEQENKLGKLLRERRTEKGMSLREFGEYLSISHAYLDKLEKGYDARNGRANAPTMEVLSKISHALNMPLDSFLTDCGYLSEPETPPVLELNTLAHEFINIVLDAERITLNGEEVTGDRDFLLKTAFSTLSSLLEL